MDRRSGVRHLSRTSAADFDALRNGIYPLQFRNPEGGQSPVELIIWNAGAKIRHAQFDFYGSDWDFIANRQIRVSSLGVLETQAVFAMKVRTGELDRKAAGTQRAMMMLDIAPGTIVVYGLRTDHQATAERLIGRYGFPGR